jgi:hypothetical protein
VEPADKILSDLLVAVAQHPELSVVIQNPLDRIRNSGIKRALVYNVFYGPDECPNWAVAVLTLWVLVGKCLLHPHHEYAAGFVRLDNGEWSMSVEGLVNKKFVEESERFHKVSFRRFLRHSHAS